MKKHLLLTTALVATFSTLNAEASDLIINEGQTITTNDLPTTGEISEDDYPIVSYIDNLKINGGTLDVNNRHMDFGDIQINSGTVKINDAYLTTHDDVVTITGGNISISNNGGLGGGDLKLSGDAVLNLDDHSALEFDTSFLQNGGTVSLNNYSRIEDNNLSTVFTMNDGTINLSDHSYIYNGYSEDAGNETDIFTAGNAIINGIINVTFDQNYMFFDTTNLGGTLNIKEKTGLSVNKGFIEPWDAQTFRDITLLDKGSINVLSNGTINLGGTLTANVANAGKMNIPYKSSARLNGNLNVNNNGEVNLSGRLTVDGDVAFNEGSTLKTTLTNKNSFGQLKANKITIADTNTTLQMAFNGGVVAKDDTIEVQILNATNIDGAFANQPESNERYNIEYMGNGVYKVTALQDTGDIINDGGYDTDSTTNMKSAAEAWDNLITDETSSPTTVAVAQKLAELSNSPSAEDRKAYMDALVALAPETAPAVEASQMQISTQVFNAVGTRMSGNSYSGYQRGLSSGDGYSDTAVWVQGMLNKAKYDKTKETKFDSDTWGTALGIEKQLDYATKFGIGYAYSKSDIDGFKRKTDVNTHTALVYAEVKPSDLFANIIASYGWSDYKEKKNVADIEVKANYDVETLGLQAMAGYDIYSRPIGVTITPEAGVRYIHIKNKEYTDTAGQKTKNEDSDVLTGVFGINLSKKYRVIYTDIRLRPEARVAMTYDFQQDDTKSTVTLPNNSAYSVTGKPLDRYGVEVGAGFTADFNNAMELSMGYEGKFREDYQDHTGLVNAKVKF